MGANNTPGTVPVGEKYDQYGNLRPGATETGAGNPLLGPLPGAPSSPAPRAPEATSRNPPGFTPTGPAPGVAAAQEADTQAFKQDQLALPAARTTEQNLMHAYDALKLTTSGKSADATHALFGYLQTNGLLPPGATDELKNYELFKKYTERNIADLGNAAGTDAGRSLAAQSNAGASLSSPANMEVIRTDVAKKRQEIAANMSAPDQVNGLGYAGHRAQHADRTDYRGFAWDMYSPVEQDKIRKSIKPGSDAEKALLRAIGMAHAFNLTGSTAAPR